MKISRRPSKQEIIELYQACAKELGRTPGKRAFCTWSKVAESDIDYYWPRPSALQEDAGFETNDFNAKLSDEQVFEDYARICIHLNKIPTEKEVRIATRDLGGRVWSLKNRFSSKEALLNEFQTWLQNQDSKEYKGILNFSGWETRQLSKQSVSESPTEIPSTALHKIYLFNSSVSSNWVNWLQRVR